MQVGLLHPHSVSQLEQQRSILTIREYLTATPCCPHLLPTAFVVESKKFAVFGVHSTRGAAKMHKSLHLSSEVVWELGAWNYFEALSKHHLGIGAPHKAEKFYPMGSPKDKSRKKKKHT